MPILCDFVIIVDDTPVTIGDSKPVFEAQFNTGGRDSANPGFLIFNVSGLTHADVDAVVSINGKQVGAIHPYRPGGAGIDTTNINQPEKWRQADHWYTQMIAFSGSTIFSGTNTIQIQAVQFPENSSSNRFDDFRIKDLICFFHQASE
ncbi:MAG TPA: hypothetical protein VEQ60_12660 [Longimicrobium sp.]|nr:hypothetical protein [Longimicrobium sp.]